MLRTSQTFILLGVCAIATPVLAQDPVEDESTEFSEESSDFDDPLADEGDADQEAASGEASIDADSSVELSADTTAAPPGEADDSAHGPGGWSTEIHGYFRAPIAMGISSRPNPETKDAATNTFSGEDQMQISYGPTRTMDANYYSFAYTRLQEQDWAEVFFHMKKKHVEAVVGWMGYWFQGAGFRNPDASWAPGAAYLKLDTDFDVASVTPNAALTVGAFWPSFGYHKKYDTYTLGRFRQIGEQLKLTVPMTPKLKLTVVQGFGTSRDGSFNINAPAPYQGQVGLDLIHYEHVSVAYDKYVEVGLHYNTEWTRDPFMWQSGVAGRNYAASREAHLDVIGAEAKLFAPYAGHLWISPSAVSVKNGFALDWAGTEVMHAIGGMGIATNYMAWTNNPPDSTGTGSMFNLGFVYENTLSNLLGEEPASAAPELSLSVFGLMANSSIDLPEGSVVTQDSIKQFKWGADLTYQALDWLALMGRYDQVNYDTDNPGYIFSAMTARVQFASHFLSSERIYLQYSRYNYGDNMTLAGNWPWGQDLIAGADVTQGSPYTGLKADENVIKLQGEVTF